MALASFPRRRRSVRSSPDRRLRNHGRESRKAPALLSLGRGRSFAPRSKRARVVQRKRPPKNCQQEGLRRHISGSLNCQSEVVNGGMLFCDYFFRIFVVSSTTLFAKRDIT